MQDPNDPLGLRAASKKKALEQQGESGDDPLGLRASSDKKKRVDVQGGVDQKPTSQESDVSLPEPVPAVAAESSPEQVRLSNKYVTKLDEWVKNKTALEQKIVEKRGNLIIEIRQRELKKAGLSDEEISLTLDQELPKIREDLMSQHDASIKKDYEAQVKYFSDMSEKERVASLDAGFWESSVRRFGAMALDQIPKGATASQLASMPNSMDEVMKTGADSKDVHVAEWKHQLTKTVGDPKFPTKYFNEPIDDMIKKAYSFKAPSLLEKYLDFDNIVKMGKRIGLGNWMVQDVLDAADSKSAGGLTREAGSVVYNALVNTKRELGGDINDPKKKEEVFKKHYNNELANLRVGKMNEMDEQSKEAGERTANVAMTWDDAKKAGQKLGYVGGAIGNAAGSSIPIMAVTAATGNPFLGLAASYAFSYQLEGGEAYDQYLNGTVDGMNATGQAVTKEDLIRTGGDREAAEFASNAGKIVAGLETFGNAFGAGKLAIRIFAKKAVENAVKKRAGKQLVDFAGGMLGSGVSESVTEGLQTLTTNVGEKIMFGMPIDDAIMTVLKEDGDELFESSLQGGIGGMFFGGFSSSADALKQKSVNELFNQISLMSDVRLKQFSPSKSESREDNIKSIVSGLVNGDIDGKVASEIDVAKTNDFVNGFFNEEGGFKPKGINKESFKSFVDGFVKTGDVKLLEGDTYDIQTNEAANKIGEYIQGRITKSSSKNSSLSEDELSKQANTILDRIPLLKGVEKTLFNNMISQMTESNELVKEGATFKVKTTEAAQKIMNAAGVFDIQGNGDFANTLEAFSSRGIVREVNDNLLETLSNSGSKRLKQFSQTVNKLKTSTAALLKNPKMVFIPNGTDATKIAQSFGKELTDDEIADGWYDRDNNTMFFVDNESAIHEVLMHPVLDAIKTQAPELYEEFNTQMGKDLKSYIDQSKDDGYTGTDINDEGIVTFLTDIAAGRLDTGLLKSATDTIKRFLAKFGIGSGTIDLDNADTLQDVAALLADALATGKKIKIKGSGTAAKERAKVRAERDKEMGEVKSLTEGKKESEEGDKKNTAFSKKAAKPKSLSAKIAKETGDKTVSGKTASSMLITEVVKGEKREVFSGPVGIDELAKGKPEMFVNRTYELAASHLGIGVAKAPKFRGDYKKANPTDKKAFNDKELAWAKEASKVIINNIKENLMLVYNRIPDDIKNVSKLWYDGANIIAQEFASKYNTTLDQAAAVIASLSPQKPWFDNLHLAQFVMDYYSSKQDNILSNEVVEYFKETGKDYPEQIAYIPALEKKIGTKFRDLSDYDRAVMARYEFDNLYDRRAPLRLPTGHIIEGQFATTETGKESRASFSGYDATAKTFAILRDASIKNIHAQLGNAPKVRSFYNNISDPSNPDEVTIDTHAIAAARLEPLGSSDSDKVKFDIATNAFYAEAYRSAAKEAGILAREMQSITWEGIKAIFPPSDKKSGNKNAKIELWNKAINGDISVEEVRQTIIQDAKDAGKTDWSEFIDRNPEEYGKSGYVGSLPLVSRNKQATRSGNGRGSKGGFSGVGKTNKPSDSFSKRKINADVVNGFYSPIEERLSEAKQDKQTVNKWKGIIGSGDEAKWTGVSGWLNSMKPDQTISKSDIMKFMKENRVEIKEVVKGDGFENTYELDEASKWFNDGNNVWGFNPDDSSWSKVKNHKELIDDYIQWSIGDPSKGGATKFSQYQLEGKSENYKEVLVTLPNKDVAAVEAYNESYDRYVEWVNGIGEPSEVDKKINKEWVATNKELQSKLPPNASIQRGRAYLEGGRKDSTFKSSHFEEPNILVHLRMNTRTDAQGNKVLFLEEVQSDWGQQGKKQGFKESQDKTKLPSGYKIIEKRGSYSWTENSDNDSDIWFRSREAAIRNYWSNTDDPSITSVTNNIPSAPFVTDTNSWVKLGLKVALKEAVKQGATKIAWTTGEQQNERYDLSKQVSLIEHYEENGKYIVEANKKSDGGRIRLNDGNPIEKNRLADFVGKDVADKIINEEGQLSDDGNWKQLMGNDLKVGGKGMKGFYGSPTEGSLGILGNVAKSLFKQEIGTISINLPQVTKVTTSTTQTTDVVSVGTEVKYNNQYDSYYHTVELADGTDEVQSYGTKEQAQEGIDKLTKLIADKGTVQPSINITPELKEQAENGQTSFSKRKWTPSKLGKGDYAITNRNPLVKNAAEDLFQERITKDEYDKTVTDNSSIKPITDFITPASAEDIQTALGKKSEGRINLEFVKGMMVGLRLDIKAYIDHNIWAISVHDDVKGGVLGYNSVARIKNVRFTTNPKAALDIARHKPLKDGTGMSKSTIARMMGEWEPIAGETNEEKNQNAMDFVDSIVDNPEWSQIGMNPFRHSYFYDRATGFPVVAADELIQIGGLVYAKNAETASASDPMFNVTTVNGNVTTFSKRKRTKTVERVIEPATTLLKGLRAHLIADPDNELFSKPRVEMSSNIKQLENASDQDVLDQLRTTKAGELYQLFAGLKGENNFSMLVMIEMLNRAIRSNDDALIETVFDKINTIGSGLGQLLNMMKQLKSAAVDPNAPRAVRIAYNRGLIKSAIEKHIESVGYTLLTNQVSELDSIVNQFVNAHADEFEKFKKWDDDRTPENLKAYEDAAKVANDKYSEIGKFVYRNAPAGLLNFAQTLIKGGLLTLASVVVNLTSNIGNAAIAPMEGTVVPIARTLTGRGDTEKGAGAWTATKASGLAAAAWLKAWGPAFMEAYIRDGGMRDRDISKFEVRRQLHPIEAWKQMLKNQMPKKAVIKNGKVVSYRTPPTVWAEKILEGTFAIPAAMMFRSLYFTDKPFREAARVYAATKMLSEIGDTSTTPSGTVTKWKTPTGKEVISFMAKMTPEQKDRIDKYADKFTFSDNKSTTATVASTVTSIFTRTGDLLDEKGATAAGIFIKVLGTTVNPYVTVPSNIVQHLIELMFPPAAIYGAIHHYKQGNKEVADGLVGRAFTGLTMYAIAAGAYTSGLILAGDDEKLKRADRLLKSEFSQPLSINLSGLARMSMFGGSGETEYKVGDHAVSLQKLGMPGIFLGFHARMSMELKENGLLENGYWHPFKNDMVDALGIMGNSMIKSSLDMSFFHGQMELMKAIQTDGRDGSFMKRFVTQNVETASNALWPNMFAQAYISNQEYLMSANNPTILGDLRERMAKRGFMFNGLTGILSESEMYPRLGFWGEPVEAKGGITPYLFKNTVAKDQAAIDIHNMMFRTGAPNPVSIPLANVTTDEGSVKLDESDYLILQGMSGRLRESYIKALMKTEDYLAATDLEKLEMISEDSDLANSEARDSFLMFLNSAIEAGDVIVKDDGSYEWVKERKEYSPDLVDSLIKEEML